MDTYSGIISWTPYCVFHYFEKKNVVHPLHPCIFETTLVGSGIAFYGSYIHSRTMYVKLVERAWRDDSNHTKYSKLQKFLQTYRVLEIRQRYAIIFKILWLIYLKFWSYTDWCDVNCLNYMYANLKQPNKNLNWTIMNKLWVGDKYCQNLATANHNSL